MADDKGRIRTPMSPATWTADEQPPEQPPEQPLPASGNPDLRPPKTPEPEKAPPPPPAKK